MPDPVRFFHIPHDQMRANFLRQLQPGNHRICPVRKRDILIERLPDGRLASLYRIFTTNPIERGGSDTLLFRRVPDRLSSEKGWIRISHHINTIQIGSIKEIIHQSVMIRMQACRHTVMVRKSHTRKTGTKSRFHSNSSQRIERRRMCMQRIIRTKTVHRQDYDIAFLLRVSRTSGNRQIDYRKETY